MADLDSSYISVKALISDDLAFALDHGLGQLQRVGRAAKSRTTGAGFHPCHRRSRLLGSRSMAVIG